MKLGFLLGGLAAVGAIVALVVAISSTQNAVPDRMKECLRDAGLTLAKGPESVGPLRRDVQAGRDLAPRTRTLGEDTAVLVSQPDYALVVLRVPDNPPVDDELLRKVAEDPAQFSVVALAPRTLSRIPAACVDKAATSE